MKFSGLNAPTEATAVTTSPEEFSCWMLNKSGITTAYTLRVADGCIKVISAMNGKLKKTLSLSKAHGRLVPKEVIEDAKRKPDGLGEEEEKVASKKNTAWYPIKLMITERKSRMLYFASRTERKNMLEAVLAEQGFKDQLDQYAVTRVIEEGCSN